ncbi:MAG: glycosyltransferase family 9 protein [Alphaproteobacteria bacterium]
MTLPLVEALIARGAERVVLLGTPHAWRFLRAPSPPLEVLDIGGREWLGLFGEDVELAAPARARLAEIDAALVLAGAGRAALEAKLRAAGVRRVAGAAPAAFGEAAADLGAWGSGEPVLAPWPPGPAHAARHLMLPLAALGGNDGEDGWPQAPLPLAGHPLLRLERREIAAALASLGLAAAPARGIVALHPGSGGAAKCWPAERFAALAAAASERSGMTPVFLVGPADGSVWRALKSALPHSLVPHALVERPLREVLALLSLARAYVGNDSGISHLAARACPTLALFGPSDPRVWHPLGQHVAVLRAPRGALARLSLGQALAGLAALL